MRKTHFCPCEFESLSVIQSFPKAPCKGPAKLIIARYLINSTTYPYKSFRDIKNEADIVFNAIGMTLSMTWKRHVRAAHHPWARIMFRFAKSVKRVGANPLVAVAYACYTFSRQHIQNVAQFYGKRKVNESSMANCIIEYGKYTFRTFPMVYRFAHPFLSIGHLMPMQI